MPRGGLRLCQFPSSGAGIVFLSGPKYRPRDQDGGGAAKRPRTDDTQAGQADAWRNECKKVLENILTVFMWMCNRTTRSFEQEKDFGKYFQEVMRILCGIVFGNHMGLTTHIKMEVLVSNSSRNPKYCDVLIQVSKPGGTYSSSHPRHMSTFRS